jgi:hypothetical protein
MKNWSDEMSQPVVTVAVCLVERVRVTVGADLDPVNLMRLELEDRRIGRNGEKRRVGDQRNAKKECRGGFGRWMMSPRGEVKECEPRRGTKLVKRVWCCETKRRVEGQDEAQRGRRRKEGD